MTAAHEQSRAARLKELDAEIDAARSAADVMGTVVRGREARGWTQSEPPEVVFAGAGDAALPAAVWVALRSDDSESVLEAMTTASKRTLLIGEREELGEGYRLQKVEETRRLPDPALLVDHFAAMLAIPSDVLGMLAQWGPDDPRTAVEVAALLDSRYGPNSVPEPQPADTSAPRPVAPGTGLSMSVQETADVLQLTSAQTKVLETLVRRAGVTITA